MNDNPTDPFTPFGESIHFDESPGLRGWRKIKAEKEIANLSKLSKEGRKFPEEEGEKERDYAMIRVMKSIYPFTPGFDHPRTERGPC